MGNWECDTIRRSRKVETSLTTRFMLYNEGFVFQKKLAAVMQYPQNTQKCKKDEKNENALAAYYFLVLQIQSSPKSLMA